MLDPQDPTDPATAGLSGGIGIVGSHLRRRQCWTHRTLPHLVAVLNSQDPDSAGLCVKESLDPLSQVIEVGQGSTR